MNTTIPFIDASKAVTFQSALLWISIGLIVALVATYIVLSVRAKDPKEYLYTFVSFITVVVAGSFFLGASLGYAAKYEAWKALNVSTIDQIEENLDLKMKFSDRSFEGMSCTEDLDDRTADAVTVLKDSSMYLVSLSATKNDDGTCTYELKPYENSDTLFESSKQG